MSQHSCPFCKKVTIFSFFSYYCQQIYSRIGISSRLFDYYDRSLCNTNFLFP